MFLLSWGLEAEVTRCDFGTSEESEMCALKRGGRCEVPLLTVFLKPRSLRLSQMQLGHHQ